MGRDTGGVRGMNVSRGDNWVLAMDVARDDDELLVVTENGYGKRTAIAEYPVKGRGTMGVKTIALTEKKGGLAGALIVREHQDLVFISQNGMVQRTSVKGISQLRARVAGRAGDEPARRRHRQRRGRGGGGLSRHRRRGGGGAAVGQRDRRPARGANPSAGPTKASPTSSPSTTPDSGLRVCFNCATRERRWS